MNLFSKIKTSKPNNTLLSENTSQKVNSSHTDTIVITIQGMMCEHCKQHVLDALNTLDAASVQVDLAAGKATLTSGKEIKDSEIKQVITDAGYQATDIQRIVQ